MINYTVPDKHQTRWDRNDLNGIAKSSQESGQRFCGPQPANTKKKKSSSATHPRFQESHRLKRDLHVRASKRLREEQNKLPSFSLYCTIQTYIPLPGYLDRKPPSSYLPCDLEDFKKSTRIQLKLN